MRASAGAVGEEGEVVDEVLLHEAGIAAAQGVGEGHAVPEVCQGGRRRVRGEVRRGCGDGRQGQVLCLILLCVHAATDGGKHEAYQKN